MQIEDVAITIPFPKTTRSTANFSVNLGSVLFDEAAKVARWTLGKLETSTKASLTCSFTLAASSDETPPNVSVDWKIPLASVSGLSVSGLSVTGESYRPYKGVRNITKSGTFQVRCS